MKKFKVQVEIVEIAYRYITAENKKDAEDFLHGEEVEGAEEIDFETIHDDEKVLSIEEVEDEVL